MSEFGRFKKIYIQTEKLLPLKKSMDPPTKIATTSPDVKQPPHIHTYTQVGPESPGHATLSGILF